MGEGEDEGGFLNCSQFTVHGIFRIDKMSYLKKRNKKYFKFVFKYISNILSIF
jgi:hypothetical protein